MRRATYLSVDFTGLHATRLLAAAARHALARCAQGLRQAFAGAAR